jgi:thioredoxin
MSRNRKSSKKNQKNQKRRKSNRVGRVGKVQHKGPIHVASRGAFERHLESGQPVIVDFWAPWCGPCKAMAPTFDRVAGQFEGEVRFLKVNTEQAPELSGAFGIRSIPTLLVLLDGEVIDSSIGLTAEATLVRMARRALDRKNGVTLGDRVKRLFGGKSDAPAAAAGA